VQSYHCYAQKKVTVPYSERDLGGLDVPVKS